MTGKKKTMEGGILWLVPNQQKYYPDKVTNDTLEELVDKLTREQSFFNKLRAEQRFTHFLNILNHKLNNSQISKDEFVKLYEYSKKVFKKYDSTIIKDFGHGSQLKDNYINCIRKINENIAKFKLIKDKTSTNNSRLNINKSELNQINNFIKKHTENTFMKLDESNLESKFTSLYNLAKSEEDFEKLDLLLSKYYKLLAIYKTKKLLHFDNSKYIYLNNDDFVKSKEKSFSPIQNKLFLKKNSFSH
jgi:hypothetical protein